MTYTRWRKLFERARYVLIPSIVGTAFRRQRYPLDLRIAHQVINAADVKQDLQSHPAVQQEKQARRVPITQRCSRGAQQRTGIRQFRCVQCLYARNDEGIARIW